MEKEYEKGEKREWNMKWSLFWILADSTIN